MVNPQSVFKISGGVEVATMIFVTPDQFIAVLAHNNSVKKPLEFRAIYDLKAVACNGKQPLVLEIS